jgi:hypothetical protein
MTTKPNPHAVEIARDETWPPDADVAAYSWQCDCGTSSELFYATDLYSDRTDTSDTARRARSFAELDSLDHTEYPHEHVARIVNETDREADRYANADWELSL